MRMYITGEDERKLDEQEAEQVEETRENVYWNQWSADTNAFYGSRSNLFMSKLQILEGHN
jgi:hypothetical protein